MRCGIPIRCATERASRTALAEQHDAAASFSGSAHSSSVTATASRPARSTSSAATAESTPPLIATSVRRGSGASSAAAAAAAPSARCSASAAMSAACSLPGESPPSSSAIARVPTRAAVEQPLARDQRDGSRAGRRQRAAALGVEARRRHAVTLDAQRDADQVAADGAAGRAGMCARRHDAAPGRRAEMLGEALAIHERRV